MPKNIGTNANIERIRLKEVSAPSTPDSGYGYLYTKTDGLYFKGDNGTEIGPLAGNSFSGAMVVRAAAQTISDNSTTAIIFDTETYDVGGWYNTGTPTRLIVPSGVERVRVTAAVGFASTAGTTGTVSARIDKDGSRFAGAQEFNVPKLASITQLFNLTTAIVSVSAGNYFELKVYQNSTTTRDTLTAAPITFMSIEAVP